MKLLSSLKNIFFFTPPIEEEEFILKKDEIKALYDVRDEKSGGVRFVSKNYDENLAYIKSAFSVPKNNDVVIKTFKIFKNTRAFLVFYDGMVDSILTDTAIIRPLLEIPQFSQNVAKDEISEKLIVHSQVAQENVFEKITDDINFGNCGLFVDGIDTAFSIDVRSWEHRNIDKPEAEQSVYGPQEAFAEMLRANSALVRKILKTEKLICEGVKVGNVSKTRGVIMYISDIANDSLVDEVKRRINGISVDYIFSIEEISLLIEEKTFLISNKTLATERPDRVARALSEGRVALVLSGSPKALIFPTNAFELMHTPSDAYMRFPYANITRIIRLIAIFISLLAPALYLAITLYHQEVVPTFLIFAISAARENVPFPSIIELIVMDIAFELISEAGIRMPSVIGSTLGIVGGLILGQAAVSAKIVSPLMIIIIAITGIGSFATPDYSLGWSLKIMRIIFIFLAAFLGFFGIAIGIFIYAVFLGAQESFGVPFLSPLPAGGKGSVGHSLFVNPIWKNEKRPSYLSPKREKQESKISRKWKSKKRK